MAIEAACQRNKILRTITFDHLGTEVGIFPVIQVNIMAADALGYYSDVTSVAILAEPMLTSH